MEEDRLLAKELLWNLEAEPKHCNFKYFLIKQNERSDYGLGEKISKLCDWQGLSFLIIQTADTTQQQKSKQSHQKMGIRSKLTFLQRSYPDGQHVHEKMLNITNY